MSNLTYHPNRVSKEDKNAKMKHASPVVWLTGLSGSGKSTIGNALEQALFERGIKTQVLDGDNIRIGLNKDLGFTDDDRKENMRRISEVAKLFSDSGTFTITAFISPFREERELCKEIIGRDNFIEVHVDADLETCERRDPKGLYKKARAGEIPMFTGIDSPYEEPSSPDIVIESGKFSLEECVDKLITQLEIKGIIPSVDNSVWTKVNHGGQSTANHDKKRAVFIGRFQPYHQGHTSLIQQKIDEQIPVLIMVRDIYPDEKNPFTTKQTVSMIEKHHWNDDVEVMVIQDIESVNYGRGVGYEINEFAPPEDLAWVSATKIRESIKNGDDAWREIVDESIQNDVIKYLTND